MDTSKIIKGVVSNGRYTVTAPIVKEDYGLYLKIEGLELPQTYEVDFSNSEHNGTSVTMIGNADGVLIPSQFISSGKDVFAFLYHVGADFGRTVYKFRIPNKVRPDRTNEEPTPEEQSTIDQVIANLNDAVESAQENADFLRNATATATTLSPDNEATVILNEGEFAFGIPKGSKGDRGEPGAKGEPGEKGDPGTDGISPTVSVTDITGGHRVAITDKTGTKNFDVMNGNDYVLTEQDKADIADIAEADLTPTILNAFPTDVASGAVASFPDGADDLPLKSLVVNIDPVQDLSNGDPSPENICPISGWTEVNVNHSDADMTNPTTLTINLGQTVYGGKLDVLSGELVIDRAMLTATECLSVSTASTGVLYASVSVATGATAKAEASSNKNISSVYKYRANDAPTDGGWFRVITNKIFIFDNRFTDKATADTILSTEQPVFVYELATPLTIQLTPNQVNSLLGINNIFADTGDTEVEYRADTKLYIERLTAPDSADMIADANIVSGQYFMVGNSLYKATANIANGSAIVVGTNCTRKSLSEALNEINA